MPSTDIGSVPLWLSFSFFLFLLLLVHKVWRRFHEYWLSREALVHVLRYEDLLTHPEESLRDLMAFVDVSPFLRCLCVRLLCLLFAVILLHTVCTYMLDYEYVLGALRVVSTT